MIDKYSFGYYSILGFVFFTIASGFCVDVNLIGLAWATGTIAGMIVVLNIQLHHDGFYYKSTR